MIGIPMYLRLARLIWTLQGLYYLMTAPATIATVTAWKTVKTVLVIASALVLATGMDQMDQVDQIIHRNDS